MSLKKTIGKNGKAYYFENGKRVKDNYYKLHWYEGGKGRMSNEAFNDFFEDLPPDIDFETARALQANYFNESKGEIEEQKLANKVEISEGVDEFVPHFAMTPYIENASKFYVRTEGSAGFIQVSEDDINDIISEKAREANNTQKKSNVYTYTRIYTISEVDDFGDIEEAVYIDYLDQFESI